MSTPTNTPTDITSPAQIARGLFPHQVEGVAFLLRRRRAVLADDMGLGKTRQAITALKVEEPNGPYLVVCPASVKRNWSREIQLVLPGAEVRVLGGAADRGALPGAEWVVVNYDVLKKHEARLAEVPWGGLVFDEAHYVRNHQSQRSRSARKLVGALEDPVVYLLTGTPLLNRPRDLFPLLQLARHPLGKSFLSFAKRYCAAYENEWGWVTDGASHLNELSVQLQGVLLRRTKDEVLDLPPKIRSWVPVDVPEKTGTAAMRKVLGVLLASQGIDVAGASRRDAGGPAGRGRLIAALSQLRHELAVAKVPQTLALVGDVVEQGHKAIVFSCFDASAKAVSEHFGPAAVLLTGATPAAKRQDLVDRFQQDPDVKVFVANLVAGGVGLNLTAATHVVFNDLDWVPANHWQAEDRAYRIGQERTVNVSYLVAAGTVDEFVETVLQTKASLVGAVVDGEALGEDRGDVLSELERLVGALSPRLADARLDDLDAEEIAALLRAASAQLEAERPRPLGAGPVRATETEAMRRALELLRDALSGPAATRYQADSTSGRGSVYDLVVDTGGDVHCSCPGFEYRGACNHARRLKAAVATGAQLPEGIRVA